MSETFEVRATLVYALRNPDCTPTSRYDLMRMAARRIEELEAENVALVGKVSSAKADSNVELGMLITALKCLEYVESQHPGLSGYGVRQECIAAIRSHLKPSEGGA